MVRFTLRLVSLMAFVEICAYNFICAIKVVQEVQPLEVCTPNESSGVNVSNLEDADEDDPEYIDKLFKRPKSTARNTRKRVQMTQNNNALIIEDNFNTVITLLCFYNIPMCSCIHVT